MPPPPEEASSWAASVYEDGGSAADSPWRASERLAMQVARGLEARRGAKHRRPRGFAAVGAFKDVTWAAAATLRSSV